MSSRGCSPIEAGLSNIRPPSFAQHHAPQQPHRHNTAKQGEPSPPFSKPASQASFQSSKPFLLLRIRIPVSRSPENHQPSPKTPYIFYLAFRRHPKTNAAFKNAMDGPPNIVFDDWIDWSKVDLLDACYMPADAGLELGGWGRGQEKNSYASPAYDCSGNLIQTPVEESLKGQNMEVGLWACNQCDLHFPGFKELSLHWGCWYHCTGANGSFNCITCGETLAHDFSPDSHGKSKRHATIACCYIGCEQQFVTETEREAHHKTPHSIGHARLFTATPFDCAQCNQSFESSGQLKRHSQAEQHQPYGCQCGIMFSRLDVLNRHLKSLDTNLPAYSCKYCRRHRGENGFRRLDHLNQHIRNYHHHEEDGQPIVSGGSRRQLKFVYPVCSYEGCPHYRGPEFQQLPRSEKEASKPFRSQSEYSKHMREEHDTCPYPCDVLGCNRIGRRGYFREKDLIKHRSQSHPEAGPYRAARREMTHACTEPGCEAVLSAGSMKAHYEWVHWGFM